VDDSHALALLSKIPKKQQKEDGPSGAARRGSSALPSPAPFWPGHCRCRSRPPRDNSRDTEGPSATLVCRDLAKALPHRKMGLQVAGAAWQPPVAPLGPCRALLGLVLS